MGSFFNIDGPFYKVGNMLADIMICSFLWFIFSLPIITMGASTTALYYVMLKRISDKEGYIFSDFFKSFKANFKISTAVWLVILIVFAILYTNIQNIELLGKWKTFIYPVQICFGIELLMVTMYIFPIISRFDMKFTEFFKVSFLMANKHMPSTLMCIAVLAAIFMGMMQFAVIFVFAVGLYTFATAFIFMRIFKKYRPELDEDY